MINIPLYLSVFEERFPQQKNDLPWKTIEQLSTILEKMIDVLGSDYTLQKNMAIHKTAIIEQNVMIKGPFIAGPGCFIAANTYFREGVYLGSNVKIGPGCEIKSSIILDNSATAHFNYIGNSVVGSHVNFEAGAVVANHYNERNDKKITVVIEGKTIQTGTEKFGALVGDHCKIGANAVLSPGTILPARSIVKRLELVDQLTIK